MNRPRLLSTATVKRLAYASGMLGGWHRLRNRRTLTVPMFHRVLDETDPRWAYCDLEYTVSTRVFEAALAFFKRHYNVIGLPSLLAGGPLPDRALLITFDDGWSDNAEYAWPLLRRWQLPALIFVAVDAVDATRPLPFWQMRLIHALRRGRLSAVTWTRLASAAGAPEVAIEPRYDLDDLLTLIARLERLDPAVVDALMAEIEPDLGETEDEGHMVSSAQLRALVADGCAIGGHGKSHRPLTRVKAPGVELRAPREFLARTVGAEAMTMSFPHGAYSGALVRDALAAGYQYLFTSDAVVNSIDAGAPLARVLGRVGIFQSELADPARPFRPEHLAWRLFRRRIARLTDERPA